MTSHRTADFRRLYDRLPADAQEQALATYDLFEREPRHPSLHFKRVSNRSDLYSVRIGIHYRALAWRERDTLYWFWIGTHAEYDQVLKKI
jgi:hypothetical protein